MDEAVRKDLASLTINSTAYEAQIYGNLLLKRLSAIVSLQDESVASLLRLWAIIVSLTDPAEVKPVYQRLLLGSPTMQKVLETEAPHPALAKGKSFL
ncbi:hypothetical protein FRC20_008964 [Serendipita sp. 405]|nr:hypothetical protein FRC20_008964 [Serendipita sp. 405]